MPVSDENRKINRMLQDVFGGNRKYARYADEEEKSTIDILSCGDSPWEGVTSYGTLGLSDYSIGKKVNDVPLRVEFVGACKSEFKSFPNILATCAFNVINSKYKCEPGTIYLEVVETYIESAMKHILFSSPSIWDKKLETIYMQPQKIVAWLQVIPISDEEFEYSRAKGVNALEGLFEKEEVDIFDLNRQSVL
jgi:hypothetical protein